MKAFARNYYIIPISCYFLLFVAVYAALYLSGVVDILPDKWSLSHWDAGWYKSIVEKGYIYKEGQVNNTGFFPLFPFFWKLTGLNALGISILNGVIYLLSLSFLCSFLKPGKITLGLFMASPLMFFMITPLSEALFFLFCSVILFGIVNNNNRYIFIGVVLASLTRASFLFFIPAFIGMSLMSNPVNQPPDIKAWRNILLWYILPCAIGVLMVVVIQFLYTGEWFAYFRVQSEHWGRKINWPRFPLGMGSPAWVVRVSQFSLWMGMLAGVMSLRYLVQWIAKKDLMEKINKHELFSFIFLSMSLVSIVFFNPTWYWVEQVHHNATYLFGINRYIHAVPFLLVVLIYLFDKMKPRAISFLWLIVFSCLIMLMVTPDYLRNIWGLEKIPIVIFMLIPYWMYWYSRWKPLGYAIILASFVLQCAMYGYFMNNIQVD